MVKIASASSTTGTGLHPTVPYQSRNAIAPLFYSPVTLYLGTPGFGTLISRLLSLLSRSPTGVEPLPEWSLPGS